MAGGLDTGDSLGLLCDYRGAMTHALGGEAMPYFIAAIPMSFGEAFFTGGTMALVVAYRPQWCATFDDARYLGKRD